MLKLVRTALTAAILTAIAVRLRRRARQEHPGQAPGHTASGPAGSGRSRRSGGITPLLLTAGAVVAVVLLVAAAFLTPAVPPEATPSPAATPSMLAASSPADSSSPAETPSPLDTPSPAGASPLATASPTAPVGASPSPDTGLRAPADLVCRPAARPAVVRPIDPRVRRAVNHQWRRIERWLRRNAPRTYATLGTRGRPRHIALAEARMGVEFPDALRASLLRHDGAAHFGLLGERLFGVRQIRALWREYCRDGGGIVPGENWDDRLIPVGGQLEGVLLVSSEDAGSVVEIGDEYMSDRPGGLRVRSYYGLLRAVADGLERGRLGELRPRVVDGALTWE
ncbi:SMI1/KNR4 family protein [Nonomuraea roseoviolacea]|uniref:SMI1/KNR4 family protein n=1 Tax=Nonomuraea roseoviolacea TaxID=103837 RepID=UPI0031DF14AF